MISVFLSSILAEVYNYCFKDIKKRGWMAHVLTVENIKLAVCKMTRLQLKDWDNKHIPVKYHIGVM